jgi:hypothetical protein
MYSQQRPIMTIAAQADASRNTVKKYIAAFKDSGFTFEEVNALNDKELEDIFGKSKEHPSNARMQSMLRCFPHVDKELKRTGVNSTRNRLIKSCLGVGVLGFAKKAGSLFADELPMPEHKNIRGNYK